MGKLAILFLVLCVGCAVDKSDNFKQQAAEIETREAFERQKAECNALGSAIVVRKKYIGRANKSIDYKSAACYIPRM